MERYNLKDYRDWFIGNFEPALLRREDFEVGVKRYKAGDVPPVHYHKIITEYTVVVEGTIKMNDEVFGVNDIVVIYPNDATKFEALTDCTLLVVKTPSIPSDKYDV